MQQSIYGALLSRQPRARVACDPGQDGIEAGKRKLQNQLTGTGLFLVGLPVIEGWSPNGSLVIVSWKVFSGQYPTEESDTP
jgi:hypothetical protein